MEDWYILTERLFGQDNDLVGCTIQHYRYPHSQNIFIIILWAVACISQRPVRHILPIIPYLDNFLSSPRLGLISLNNIFGSSINSSLESLWTNWDHGWVEKKTSYNIPMCYGNFIQQTICRGHPPKATLSLVCKITFFFYFGRLIFSLSNHHEKNKEYR